MKLLWVISYKEKVASGNSLLQGEGVCVELFWLIPDFCAKIEVNGSVVTASLYF